MPDAREPALRTLKDIDRAISALDMERARHLAAQLHRFIAQGSIDEMSDISAHLQRSLGTARSTRESLKAELKTVLGKRHGVNVYQRNER